LKHHLAKTKALQKTQRWYNQFGVINNVQPGHEKNFYPGGVLLEARWGAHTV
jgi:hypothetical protein